MSLLDIDSNLQKLTRRLESIESAYSNTCNLERRTILQQKIRLGLMEKELNKLHHKFVKLKDAKISLPAYLAAIVHWTANICDRTLRYFNGYSRVLNSHMWIELVRSRLTGHNNKRRFSLADSDIIEMALRKKDLETIEKDLAEELVQLKTRKRELQLSYETLLLKKSNAIAANSLAERITHPERRRALQKLAQLMTKLFIPSKPPTPAEQKLRQLQNEARKTSSEILQAATSYLTGHRHSPSMGKDTRRRLTLKANKIEQIQLDIQQARDQALIEPEATLKPIMKKSTNQGTTVRDYS